MTARRPRPAPIAQSAFAGSTPRSVVGGFAVLRWVESPHDAAIAGGGRVKGVSWPDHRKVGKLPTRQRLTAIGWLSGSMDCWAVTPVTLSYPKPQCGSSRARQSSSSLQPPSRSSQTVQFGVSWKDPCCSPICIVQGCHGSSHEALAYGETPGFAAAPARRAPA